MAPINLPDGTEVSEVILPDGATASEVVAPDGDRVFSVIPDSGISRWEFEGDATDSWGSNGGSITGATFTSDSAVGSQALSFDGNDVVTIGNVDALKRADEGVWSYSAWVKITDKSSAAYHIMGSSNGTAALSLRARDLLTSGDVIPVFNVRNGGTGNSERVTGSTILDDGSYHHVVATCSGNNDATNMTIYVDGNEDNTSVNQDQGAGTFSTNIDFTIGERADGGSSMDGLIDDPRAYDKELTASEVNNLYNNGSI